MLGELERCNFPAGTVVTVAQCSWFGDFNSGQPGISKGGGGSILDSKEKSVKRDFCPIIHIFRSHNLIDFGLELLIDQHQVVWHLHSQSLDFGSTDAHQFLDSIGVCVICRVFRRPSKQCL